jgi:outer membrane protein OmpA-like peptidoglycan-associated protein
MKRILFFLMGILPLTTVHAQTDRSFPENVVVTVEKTGVNTVRSDFGPAFVGQELWVSAFSDAVIANWNEESSRIFYNLYAIPVDGDGHITGNRSDEPLAINGPYHAGPVSCCRSTGEVFVTLSNHENPAVENLVFQKARVPLKINVYKRSGDAWSLSQEFPFNSPDWSTGHPAISPTGDTLIFASDIPGKGHGGTDLYMTVRQNGEWGELINLGDEINTSGDEMFPFFMDGKVLFFASGGLPGGQGGLDLYYAYHEAGKFESPENMTSLNSSADDFGLVVHPDQKTGYFTSNRPGGEGDDDIYKVLFEETGEYDLELLVLDRKSREPVSDVKVNFSDDLTLYTGGNGVVTRKLEKDTRYTATSEHSGYMNQSVFFTTVGKPYGTLKEVIEIEQVEVGQKFVMENIYYDFDKWDILPESAVELDKLVKVMKDNPSWKVELGSHTDSRGPDEYNEWLSQKRSESAVEYIISNGIDRDRITAKGYGETQLVNACGNDVPCSEAEHRKNRRTEFKILEMD